MQRDHRRKGQITQRDQVAHDQDGRDTIPDAVVDELAALHARIETLESGFGDMIRAARAKASKAVESIKNTVHKATEHTPPLEKFKHLLESKKITFAFDGSTVMISHGNNTFHIEADGSDTLKVSYADVVKGQLSPQAALDLVQGRNLTAIFAPSPSVRGPPPTRLVPSAALLQYSAAIMQQQQQYRRSRD